MTPQERLEQIKDARAALDAALETGVHGDPDVQRIQEELDALSSYEGRPLPEEYRRILDSIQRRV